MGERTRVAVLEAPRRLGVVERPKPTPGRGEVVVRVAATAICHTDLEIYTGRHPGVRYPVVMGHEATGVIEAVGPEVVTIAPGQRVLINPIMSCGACDCCVRGQDNICRRAGLFGREVDGSLAGHVLLPERNVHALPDHLPLPAATLIETLATVRHAQDRVGIMAGQSVVVLGQGATGLLHTQLAGLSGGAPVIAVSRSRWKLDLARRMRADHVVDAARDDLVAEVLRLTGGRGADVAIDATGRPEIWEQAVDAVGRGGSVVFFGGCAPGTSIRLETRRTHYEELSLLGAFHHTPELIRRAVELVESGALVPDGLISHRMALEDVPRALDMMAKGDALKVLIEP